MNLLYSTNNNYADLVGVSLYSYFLNNADVATNVYILSSDVSAANKEKFVALCKQYHANLTFLDFEPLATIFQSFQLKSRWDVTTFGRLFAGNLLKDVDKVLYLDADTIINESIKEIWDIPIEQYAIAGVSEVLNYRYLENIGLKKDDHYLQAGVLLMNLKMMRQLEVEKDFIQFIQEHNYLTYADQDVLNAVIKNEYKLLIPPKYNVYSLFFYFSRPQIIKLRRLDNFAITNPDYMFAQNHPKIIHYTGCFMAGRRPWQEKSRHVRIGDFLFYKSTSPWKETPPKPDRRRILKRIGEKLLAIQPKRIITWIGGYLHGKYLPRRDAKRIKREARILSTSKEEGK